MAMRAGRICATCRRAILSGGRCGCEIKRDQERKARFDATRPTARERGYGSKWEQARADFLAAHPTCNRCGAPSTVVNHVIPHKGDMKLFWRRSNWEAVCKPCHDGPIQSQERRI